MKFDKTNARFIKNSNHSCHNISHANNFEITVLSIKEKARIKNMKPNIIDYNCYRFIKTCEN